MHVYHYSDDPNISVFEPRALVQDRGPGNEWLNEPLVWAIDEWHSPLYYFPRDCPRILIWRTDRTTPEDLAAVWSERDCRMLAHIERDWFERLRDGRIYRYVLDASGFQQLIGPGKSPGTWVSTAAVRPLDMKPVGPLLDALREAQVELRVMPSLAPLRNAWESSFHVSGIRLRNAKDWPA